MAFPNLAQIAFLQSNPAALTTINTVNPAIGFPTFPLGLPWQSTSVDLREDYFLPDSWNGKTVTFTNVMSGTCVDMSSGGSGNGNKIQGWSANQSNAQQWKLEKYEGGKAWSPWLLHNVASGTYLNLNDGSASEGSIVSGWTCAWGSKNQHWFLITQEGENGTTVMIQNAGSFLYLDLENGSKDNGTNIKTYNRGMALNPHQNFKMDIV